jgi:hypothetical protein
MLAKLAQKEQEHAKRQAKALGRSLQPSPPKVSPADRVRSAKTNLAKRVLTRQKAEVEVLACQACITQFASSPVVNGFKTEFDWLTDHHAYATERSAVRASVGNRLATANRRLKQALNKEKVSVEAFRLATLLQKEADAGLASRAKLPKQTPKHRDKFDNLRAMVRDEISSRKRLHAQMLNDKAENEMDDKDEVDEADEENKLDKVDMSPRNALAPESPLTIESAL